MGRPAIGIVVQARMGSTRLPGKVLQSIAGRPLLDHIVGRLEPLRGSVQVVVATSDHARDDVLQSFCDERGLDCFRGSERDVLGRYHACAVERKFDHVVRMTADNPFTDIEEVERLIDTHLREGNDYTSSTSRLPVGVGAEIFSFAALDRSFREGHAPHHREHVNEYLLDHPERFRVGTLDVPASKRRPDVRLTVDTEEDLRRARFVAEHAAGRWVTTEEAIALCSRFA